MTEPQLMRLVIFLLEAMPLVTELRWISPRPVLERPVISLTLSDGR